MKSKKKIKKSIESLKKQRDLHKEKITELEKKDRENPLIDYWEKEIEKFDREIEKEEEKL